MMICVFSKIRERERQREKERGGVYTCVLYIQSSSKDAGRVISKNEREGEGERESERVCIHMYIHTSSKEAGSVISKIRERER